MPASTRGQSLAVAAQIDVLVRDRLSTPDGSFDAVSDLKNTRCPRPFALAECARQPPPDLCIVTPFVIVQDNLRKLLRDSGVIENWADDPDAWVRERVGTAFAGIGRAGGILTIPDLRAERTGVL
jgi:hypothetical protein